MSENNATVGSTFNQRNISNGDIVYIHDNSDLNNDSLVYGVGLIYGSQLVLDTPSLSSWYFSHAAVLPIIVEQVRSYRGFLRRDAL